MDSKKILVTEDMFTGKSTMTYDVTKELAEQEGYELVHISLEMLDEYVDSEMHHLLISPPPCDISHEVYKLNQPRKQKNPPRSFRNTGKGKQRRW